MRITFSISNKNEPELLALYHQLGSRNFSNFIKDALRYTVRPNYVGTIQMPETLFLKDSDIKEKVPIDISITAERDSDIVTLLQSVKPHMLPKFLKQCTRNYLGTKSLEAYFTEDFSEKLASVTRTQFPIVYQIGGSAQQKTRKRTRTSSNQRTRQTVNAQKTTATTATVEQEPGTCSLPTVSSAPVPTQTIPSFISTPSVDESTTENTDSGTDEEAVLNLLDALLS